MTAGAAHRRVDIAIGGMVVGVRTSDEAFLRMLRHRYAGFLGTADEPDYEFDVELTPPSAFPRMRTSAFSVTAADGVSSAATSAPSGTR